MASRCCTALSRRLRSTRPRLSLAFEQSRPFTHSRPSLQTPSDPDAPAIQSFASALRQRTSAGAAATEPYAAYGTTDKMYGACSAAGDYTFTPPGTTPSNDPSARQPFHFATGEEIGYPATNTWHTAYSLPPTFSTWAQLTFLHLHILHLRIRQFPAAHARSWSQNLLDHFFYAAEERMVSLHNMETRGIRTRYLKDLFEQWRGAEVSYDEGLVRGDAVLAAAVWRNVFQGREDVDAVHVAEVVGWMRKAAKGLAGLSDAEFASGRWKFGVPWEGGEMGQSVGAGKTMD